MFWPWIDLYPAHQRGNARTERKWKPSRACVSRSLFRVLHHLQSSESPHLARSVGMGLQVTARWSYGTQHIRCRFYCSTAPHLPRTSCNRQCRPPPSICLSDSHHALPCVFARETGGTHVLLDIARLVPNRSARASKTHKAASDDTVPTHVQY